MLRGASKIMVSLLLCGQAGLALAEPPPAAGDASVLAVLRDWQEHSAQVRIVLPAIIGRDWLPAALAADALLRSLSARPVTAADGSAAATLRLTSLPLVDAGAIDVAVVDAEPAALTVSAISAAAVARALIRLRQPVLQMTCNSHRCQIPLLADPQAPLDSGDRPKSPQSAGSPAQVLTVGNLGHPGGYTARGEGRHVLAFSFHRPAHWQIEQGPTLRLFVARSLHPILNAEASSIEVRLQGQSLGRFPLAAPAGRGLLVSQPIPQSFWSLPSWNFEVVSTLASTTGSSAGAAEASPLWLSIAPHSSLSVPRREPLFPHSLAAWHRQLATGRPQLQIDQPIPSMRLPQLGAALFPWSGPTPWRIAEPGTDCRPPCLEIRMGTGSRSADGEAPEEMTIAVMPGTSGAPGRALITLWQAGEATAPLASPDYAEVVTTTLQLRRGRFTPTGGSGRQSGEVRIRDPGSATAGDTPLVSDRAAQRVQFDWAWGLLCLLGLALGWQHSSPRPHVGPWRDQP